MEDYKLTKQLSKGGQGSTCIATEKRSQKSVVIKMVACDSIKAGNQALQECKVLQALRHPYIVEYLDFFLHQDGSKQELLVCTVMEFCKGGDLACHMNGVKVDGKRLEERVIVRWTRHMMQALAHLHDSHILHRDVKPLNVFLTEEGRVKMGDFGLASNTRKDKASSQLVETRVSHEKPAQVGTPAYLAPEVLQNEDYGPPVDVWGVGCILLEMMTLEFLWERKGLISLQVLSRPVTIYDFPQDYSSTLRKLAANLLHKDAHLRPTPQKAALTCQLLSQEGSNGALVGRKDSKPDEPSRAHESPNNNADWRAAEKNDSPGLRPSGKVGDFRRKTPGNLAHRPKPVGDAQQDPANTRVGGKVNRRGGVTQQDVTRALTNRRMGRYSTLFEEHELWGDVLGEITLHDLEKDLGITDANDRAVLMSIIRELVTGQPHPVEVEPRPSSTGSATRARPKPLQKEATNLTQVGVWLGRVGFGKYKEVFSANGIHEMHMLANLNRPGLIAMGIPETVGAKEVESDVNLLYQAIRRYCAAQEGLDRSPDAHKRKGKAANGRDGDDLDEEEKRMVEEAIHASLNDSASASSSDAFGTQPSSREPGSRDTYRSGPTSGSQPGSGFTRSSSVNSSQPGSDAFQPPSLRRQQSTPASNDRHDGRYGIQEDRDGSYSLTGLLEVTAKDGKAWRPAYCMLRDNRFYVFWGDFQPERGTFPDMEVVMDGLCVDAWDGRPKSIFIKRSMHQASDRDLLLHVRDADLFVAWLQAMQASAYFCVVPGALSPEKKKKLSIILQKLVVINASLLMQNMFLVVTFAKSSGEVLHTEGTLDLQPHPTERVLMEFDLSLEFKAPTDKDAGVYFEIRHHKSGKPQATKYWTCILPGALQVGPASLQVYKAPVQYNVKKQKLQPKASSKLNIMVSAA